LVIAIAAAQLAVKAIGGVSSESIDLKHEHNGLKYQLIVHVAAYYRQANPCRMLVFSGNRPASSMKKSGAGRVGIYMKTSAG
jgi:hypothetical protein